MSGKNYLPYQDADFIVWLQNFSIKLGTYAAALGVTPAEVTQFQTDLIDTTKKLNDVQSIKTNLQSVVQSKNDLFAVVEKRIRDKVVILKRQSDYTIAIGEDLGIVPPEALGKSVSLDAVKPEFTATVLPDMVRMDWVKGQFDGVVVQSKRGAEASFTVLDKDTKSPYEDTRHNINPDQHEARTYRMRYLVKDQEVGLWTDEVKVYCMF